MACTTARWQGGGACRLRAAPLGRRCAAAVFVLAAAAALPGAAADDEACSGIKDDLFIPLTVYFFTTLAVLLGTGAWFYWSRRGGLSLSCLSLAAARKQGGDGFGGYDDDEGGSTMFDRAAELGKEAWAIASRDLRFGPRIGVGNVGEVYRGTFRGRTVAIKKLLGAWYTNDDMVERFREEIVLMSTMNHNNVLSFVGAVMERDAGNICLVTELCERGTLSDVLRSPEPLSWPRRLKMARDVALGMDYLHTKAGVIQRDLKTENLLVSRDFEVKIADFGLSRTLQPGAMQTYCGTPATMAPEIVRQEPYSEKADVFSFGIILWELLTREPPYPGTDNGLGLAFAVANEGRRPLIPSYCPREWGALMTRCWAEDPSARPTFDECQRILFKIQDGIARAMQVGRGLQAPGGGGAGGVVARRAAAVRAAAATAAGTGEAAHRAAGQRSGAAAPGSSRVRRRRRRQGSGGLLSNDAASLLLPDSSGGAAATRSKARAAMGGRLVLSAASPAGQAGPSEAVAVAVVPDAL